MQFYASGTNEFHLMTDVVSGVFSVICTALFLRFVWHPKTRFLLKADRDALAKAGKSTAAATTDSERMEIQIYGRGNHLRVAAVGDLDPVLCALGHCRISRST